MLNWQTSYGTFLTHQLLNKIRLDSPIWNETSSDRRRIEKKRADGYFAFHPFFSFPTVSLFSFFFKSPH